MSDRPVNVSMWPRWPDNPYLADLRGGLEAAGVDVADARWRQLWKRRGILHVQWPDQIWSGSVQGRLARVVDVASLLLVARALRCPLVVTMHNVEAHESEGRIGRWIVRSLLASASRAIVLSEGGRERLLVRYPAVDAAGVDVVAHMDWADRYGPMDQSEARSLLPDLPDGPGPLIVWFGLIRPYKGVQQLVDLVASDDTEERDRLRLVLLGERSPAGSQAELASTVGRCDRIVHLERKVSDDEIRAACALADVAVFPFIRVENSGSVIAAMATRISVLAPRLGALGELAEQSSLQLYDGELNSDVIRAALTEPLPDRAPVVGGRSVSVITERHLESYARASTTAD